MRLDHWKMVARTRASVARRADDLVRQVLEQEEARVAATPPERLSKLDPLLGRPSTALDAAAYWVAMGRAEPQQHECLVRAEWKRRCGQVSKAELRLALMRIEGRASAWMALVGGRGRMPLHKSWGELNAEEQAAAETLGWWKQAWADAAAPTVRGTRTDGLVAMFADLRPEQKHAAQVLRLNAGTWELLAAADAAQDRRVRAEAAAAETAAEMSESASEDGSAANDYDDSSSDEGGHQRGDVTAQEEEVSRCSTRREYGGEENVLVDGGDDASSAQRAVLECAAEKLKAELCERRASNLALQEEASQAVVDPPWRGHSLRAGWTIARQARRKGRPRHATGADPESCCSRESVATGSGEESHPAGPIDCAIDAERLPLTPRSQAEDVAGVCTPRRRRRSVLQQRPQHHGLGQIHGKNAAAWLQKRSARVSSVSLEAEPAPRHYLAAEELLRSGPAVKHRVGREGHRMPHAHSSGTRPRIHHATPTPRCCDDERAWVRSAVASLSLE